MPLWASEITSLTPRAAQLAQEIGPECLGFGGSDIPAQYPTGGPQPLSESARPNLCWGRVNPSRITMGQRHLGERHEVEYARAGTARSACEPAGIPRSRPGVLGFSTGGGTRAEDALPG